jgi:Ran GTPase-activating protein (RanGAP) involved in mRNA processing and transport
MLAANTVLKGLDLSDNTGPGAWDSEGFVQELAVGIRDNGALTKFDISKNRFYAAGAKALAEGLKCNQVMTELKLAGNSMGQRSGGWDAESDMSGVIALADAIPDMGALSILNMSKNGMKGTEAGKALGDALAMNTVLKELDLSGQPETSQPYARQNMDVAFVKAFAPGLSDNGALSSLNLASNCLCGVNEWGVGIFDASGNAACSISYHNIA